MKHSEFVPIVDKIDKVSGSTVQSFVLSGIEIELLFSLFHVPLNENFEMYEVGAQHERVLSQYMPESFDFGGFEYVIGLWKE